MKLTNTPDRPFTDEAVQAETGKGKTGITLTQERIPARGEADGLRAGWSAAFDRLKAVLEGG